MHPRATKFNALFSFNDFKANYEWSEGLYTPRPREIDLSTNLYANYFAYEPSMDWPDMWGKTDTMDPLLKVCLLSNEGLLSYGLRGIGNIDGYFSNIFHTRYSNSGLWPAQWRK